MILQTVLFNWCQSTLKLEVALPCTVSLLPTRYLPGLSTKWLPLAFVSQIALLFLPDLFKCPIRQLRGSLF